MTNAISAFGTLLKIGDGAGSEVFTAIAEVNSVSGPSLGLDTTEVTNHQSAGGWEEVLPTILRSGEITLDLNFIPTDATQGGGTTGLLADLKAKTKRNFELVFPDSGGTTWSFAAYVTGFAPSAPHDDKLGASVTLKITGQPTLN